MNINNPLSELKTVNREHYRQKLSREGYSCLEEFEDKLFSFVCEKDGKLFFIACFDGDQKDEVFTSDTRNLMDAEIIEWLSSSCNHLTDTGVFPVAWFMDGKETPLANLLPDAPNGGMRAPTRNTLYLKAARKFLSSQSANLVLDTPGYDVLRFVSINHENDEVRFITCFSGDDFFEEPRTEIYLSRLISDAVAFLTENGQVALLELEPSFDVLSVIKSGEEACIRYHKNIA